ncbi:leucine-rich repeat-containing protein 45-like isoform X2 [Argiope bruennichi]|uniref:leucine-rich repeat-containing protein 45-like isoform X2 n=1 Tax=Argiope bruennichi TaxID=94029 RepID=UPI0024941A2D|nr:leucine-rich repeat-containing protein 45-like isoform X2 [Argiope bruennichi]
MRGNNIRSSGTEVLGKFLRHNNHLQNLFLEWNGLGIFPEKFAIFCEGLSINSSLKVLDLRNNQLNHVCAQAVSNALVRNSSLQKLDLRWNNIGLIGGRSVLKSLSRNKTIISLDIAGNDLPSDLLEAIEIATSASAQRYITNNEYITRSQFLTSKLQEKEEERNTQVKSLMEQLEKMDKDALMQERLYAEKLIQVEEALVAKDKMCENLTARIRELETELHSLSEKNNQLALTVNANEIQYKESVETIKSSLNKELRDKEKIERELLEKIGTLKEENLFLKQQIQDLKISQTHSSEQMVKFQENIVKLEATLKQEQELFKNKIAHLNERHAEIIKENEELHQNEISRIREDFSDHEKILKQKISLLESRKNELEQELKEKTIQMFSERKHAEAMQIQIEKKLKSDHEMIRQQLEERIAMLEDTNKEQNDHMQRDLQVLYQLKTDITGLDLELSEQAHEIQHLKKCLEEKDIEMKNHEAKVKLEVKDKLEELQRVKDEIQGLKQQNDLLHEKIKEIEIKHQEELQEKDDIIQNLKEQFQLQHSKINQMMENEKKRTLQLQKAFETYMKAAAPSINDNAVPSGDTSPLTKNKEDFT